MKHTAQHHFCHGVICSLDTFSVYYKETMSEALPFHREEDYTHIELID